MSMILNVEHRLQEVERQTELLRDRTQLVGSQTDGLRKSLLKESHNREVALGDMSADIELVRKTMRDKLNSLTQRNNEIDSFRTAANGKLDALLLARSSTRDVEKEVQRAVYLAEDTADSQTRWQHMQEEAIEAKLGDLNVRLSDKIACVHSGTEEKIDADVHLVRQTMKHDADEQKTINRALQTQLGELTQKVYDANLALEQESSTRSMEVQEVKRAIADARKDQQVEQQHFERQMTERIRAWEEQNADLHASALERVEQVRLEILAMLNTLEESTQSEFQLAQSAHETLLCNLHDALSALQAEAAALQSEAAAEAAALQLKVDNNGKNFATLQQKLDSNTAETDVLSAMVDHNKLIFQEDIDNLRIMHRKYEAEIGERRAAHQEVSTKIVELAGIQAVHHLDVGAMREEQTMRHEEIMVSLDKSAKETSAVKKALFDEINLAQRIHQEEVALVRKSLFDEILSRDAGVDGKLATMTTQFHDMLQEMRDACMSRNDFRCAKDELEKGLNDLHTDILRVTIDLERKNSEQKNDVDAQLAQHRELMHKRGSERDDKVDKRLRQVSDDVGTLAAKITIVSEELSDAKHDAEGHGRAHAKHKHDVAEQLKEVNTGLAKMSAHVQQHDLDIQHNRKNGINEHTVLRDEIEENAQHAASEVDRIMAVISDNNSDVRKKNADFLAQLNLRDEEYSAVTHKINVIEASLVSERNTRTEECHKVTHMFDSLTAKCAENREDLERFRREEFTVFCRDEFGSLQKNTRTQGDELRAQIRCADVQIKSVSDEITAMRKEVDAKYEKHSKESKLAVSEFRDRWGDQKSACDQKHQDLESLQVNFAELERKLRDSPMLERVMKPPPRRSPGSILSKSNPDRPSSHSQLRQGSTRGLSPNTMKRNDVASPR